MKKKIIVPVEPIIEPTKEQSIYDGENRIEPTGKWEVRAVRLGYRLFDKDSGLAVTPVESIPDRLEGLAAGWNRLL